VDAVRDRADGHLVERITGPHGLRHFPCHEPVQFGDAIGIGRMARREKRHVERLVRVGGILPAVGEELLYAEASIAAVFAEILIDQLRLKAVEARRHGRVSGEHRSRGGHLPRFVVRQLQLFHRSAGPLRTQKRRVPFVHMADCGPDAQCPKGAQPADAEHDLLLDP